MDSHPMGVSISDFDIPFVILSFGFSVLGSGLALLAVDVAAAKAGRQRIIWSAVAGLLLGGVAVWVMHFVGMLAFQPGPEISYDIVQSVVSAGPAVLATSLGVWIVVQSFSVARLAGAGALVATGVVAMHYTGMGAMRMNGATMSYSWAIVGLSILIAVVAATAALFIAVKVGGWLRFASAPVMGLAVCAMHYTGMLAMRTTHGVTSTFAPTGTFSQTDVTLAVSTGAFALLLAGALALGIEFLRMDPDEAIAR